MIHIRSGVAAPLRPEVGSFFALLQECLPIRRRQIHEGATIYRAGEAFVDLHIVRSGVFKSAIITKDGREKVLGLRFAGDWLGFDGIAESEYLCDTCAVEAGEIWSVRYDSVLLASRQHPEVAALIHRAMSDEMAQDRESMQSMCTLPADARVARFLVTWLETMSRIGLRTDRISLPMTRSEIGNYLGLTLESVSRAFSRLVREDVIRFVEVFHRELEVRDVEALSRLAQSGVVPPDTVVH